MRAGALIMLLMGGRAMAATSDGALITNMASATYYQLNNGAAFGVSYSATAWVLIQNPCLSLQKAASPTSQTPGQPVTFTICLLNCSTTGSAFNLTVWDIFPTNMGFVTGSLADWGWNGPVNPYNSTDNATWVAGPPGSGAASPLYLRWLIPGGYLGIGRSACVTYQATVQ